MAAFAGLPLFLSFIFLSFVNINAGRRFITPMQAVLLNQSLSASGKRALDAYGQSHINVKIQDHANSQSVAVSPGDLETSLAEMDEEVTVHEIIWGTKLQKANPHYLIVTMAVMGAGLVIVAIFYFWSLGHLNIESEVEEVHEEDANGASGETVEPVVKSDEAVEAVSLVHWAIFPLLLLLVVFSVPSMSYALYKPMLESVLGLTPAESGDIASFGLIGGMMLGMVCGFMYDKFGYVVTLATGGLMASAGAFVWFLELQDGGEKGAPGWFSLAWSSALMCFGCRTQYFAGMGVVLGSGIYPHRFVGSLAALMAIGISVGYILLPLFWKVFFLTKPGDPGHGTLKPVANFYLLLAIIYASITVSGLSIARFVPRKPRAAASEATFAERFAERWQKLKEPASVSLLIFAVFSMSFVYTYMVNGLAPISIRAGAKAAERAHVIFIMGNLGMLGRFIHGFGADALRSCTPAGQAGTYIAYMSAVLSTFVGFLILALSLNGAFPIAQAWVWATYAISFGFGGLFALFPASARTVYGAKEVGLFLGFLFAIIGVLNFTYSRLGAAMNWNVGYFYIACCGSLLSLASFAYMIKTSWGQ